MNSVNKKQQSSRRRFLALGGFGLGGSWLGFSNAFAARFIRERITETRRDIQPAKFKPTPAIWSDRKLTTAWLGHSSVLINFYGLTILTDPVLFSRVGADLGVGTVGPKRFTAPALLVHELPPVDLVLLSHAHMDHMDMATLDEFTSTTRVVTARQTADLLSGTKLSQPCELGWGDKTVVKTKKGDVEIEAFEVNHWGARWKRDTYRGWNGYILSRGGKKIIFGGDTAMCHNFRTIRSKGPFEIVLMPIGAYNPWIHAHCTPEQAVQMVNDAGGNYIVPIHHQAFNLGREPMHEPIERFQLAMAKEPERIALREVGETFSI